MPPSHMRILHENAVKCVHREQFSVLGGTHNDTFEVAGIEYYRRLAAFVHKYVQTEDWGLQGPQGQIQEASVAESGAATTTAGLRSSSSGSVVEDGEYLLVEQEPHVHLPTMNTHFQVK